MIEISVNLATHNRAAFLESCLISLCEQTLAPSRFEICVVANACIDTTPEVVRKIATLYPAHRVFMIEEPVPGLSRARNCGLRSTQAPLVAHIDDDGTVYPDWLERFIARFTEFGSTLAAVSGEIEPVWESPRPAWLVEDMLPPLSAKTMMGAEPRFLSEDDWAMEGNCCYRRAALEQAGNFSENLGRAGACLLSGEGCLEHNIRKNGGRLFFDPKIILRHFIHADRLQPLWFRQRYFWQGISCVAVQRYKAKHGLPTEKEKFLRLPLEKEDWGFIEKDTTDAIETSISQFHDLGFVLALSGIIPIEQEVSAR